MGVCAYMYVCVHEYMGVYMYVYMCVCVHERQGRQGGEAGRQTGSLVTYHKGGGLGVPVVGFLEVSLRLQRSTLTVKMATVADAV